MPYTQGYYLFSGTENVARNYHVVAVTKEGEECPLASYEKGTVHTDYTLAVDEHEADGFKVYPNPSNGSFTVEGTGHLTVLNLLGQEILTHEINGTTTLELPQGIYFMRLGSVTRKVVVE